MTDLVVLGATGSVGRQTLDVATHLGMTIVAMAAARTDSGIRELALSHPGADIVIAGGSPSDRQTLAGEIPNRVEFGEDAVADLASRPDSVVMNGIVGAAGLTPTMNALEAGNKLCLANKESLVLAGSLVRDAVQRGGGTLVPVDSEHSALHQLVIGVDAAEIDSLVLTASGGPFRGKSAEEMEDVSVEQALDHPTWRMGGRITIDSATLVNKGLEVIEAHVLFGFAFDDIEVIVHPQSLVHSLVRLADGALLAHVGHADMRVPIQYALTTPERRKSTLPRFDLAGRTLQFEHVDHAAFPALGLAYAAGRAGGGMPAVFNAADEIAVAAFLQGRLGFNGIARVIDQTMAQCSVVDPASVAEVIDIDADARGVAAALVSRAC
jgi:1-deoxy-D-xylulose-5-phosphate reductoisomerase